MPINFPIPHLVDTGCAVDYDTASVKEIQKHMYMVSIKLEEALRNEGRLCGLIGHTIIGSYDLRGDFETVLANMIYFRLDLMSTNWKRNDLIALSKMMGKRCTKFISETFYNTPARPEADRLLDESLNAFFEGKAEPSTNYMSVLEDYQLHLHNGKQCLCHSNK